MLKPRRIAFAGTPVDAVPALTALVEAGFEVPLVVTAPPARRSRRAKPTPTPVALAAQELGLKVSHEIAAVLGDASAPDHIAPDYVVPDCVVVVAFGQLISAELLTQLPMLNLHFSLLPQWRGAAPVERALLAGDTHVGVCLMQIEPSLDTGPVYWREQIEVASQATATELRSELATIGARRLVQSLQSGLGEPTPQQGEPTYAKKLTQADHQLLWHLSATQLERVVRVGQAWTSVAGNVLKVHEARVRQGGQLPNDAAPNDAAPGSLWGQIVRCGEDALELVRVQPAGKAPMAAADWLRGARLEPGIVLGN